jgi:hypothetical protein
VIAVAAIHSNQDLHLRLAPEARTIRRRQFHSGSEPAALVFAVLAKKLNPGLRDVAVGMEGVIREELKTDVPR